MFTTICPLTRLPRPLSRRTFSLSTRHAASSFTNSPAPPRLPKEEQELFEKLQKASTGAFSQPRETVSTPTTSSPSRPQINQSPDSTLSSSSVNSSNGGVEVRFENGKEIRKGEDLHPNMRRGAPPEFEGEVNPKTGEVGGPKNEPLRWGAVGDWSYNGRVTDF